MDPSQAPPMDQSGPVKSYTRKPSMDGLEWRVSEGLLATLFALTQAYLARGSAREADYFAQQALSFAEAMNAPAMTGRALTKRGEVQLCQGLLEDSRASLSRASEILCHIPGIDTADMQRLLGRHNERTSQNEDAQQLYTETRTILDGLEKALGQFDGHAFGYVLTKTRISLDY